MTGRDVKNRLEQRAVCSPLIIKNRGFPEERLQQIPKAKRIIVLKCISIHYTLKRIHLRVIKIRLLVRARHIVSYSNN